MAELHRKQNFLGRKGDRPSGIGSEYSQLQEEQASARVKG